MTKPTKAEVKAKVKAEIDATLEHFWNDTGDALEDILFDNPITLKQFRNLFIKSALVHSISYIDNWIENFIEMQKEIEEQMKAEQSEQ